MNLYYCQAGYDTIDLDLMVVAGDVETAIEVWRKVQIAVTFLTAEELEVAACEPFLVNLHLSRPEQGYIEWGTFKLIPTELP